MPDWKPEIRRRLANLKLEPTREAEIIEELSQHLDDRYQEMRAKCATDEGAARTALAELSENDMLQRELRRVERPAPVQVVVLGARGGNVFLDLWQDLRYSARMLRKSPGFSFIAVLTLALGIGANTAIFSVVNTVLLRPLPYPDSDRLVRLWVNLHRPGLEESVSSAPELIDYRAESRSFERIAGYTWRGFNLTGDDAPERIVGARASTDLFPLLGVSPVLGRWFLTEEERPGGDTVVIVSYGLWQRRFGGDPDIVGRTLLLDGKPFTVVGVMPAGFEFPFRDISVWQPLAFDDEEINERGSHGFEVIGRLRPDVTLPQAQAEMNSVSDRLRARYPGDYTEGLGLTLLPQHQQMVAKIRPTLLLLLGAVAFVLLIACANVANLLLARGSSRQREIAIRQALGANRSRIVWQLLTESLVLALSAAVLGVLLALVGIHWFIALEPEAIPRLSEITIDVGVLTFTLALSALTTVLFGLVPALQISGVKPNEWLKENGRSASHGRRRLRVRGALVIAEVALALILLAGAGLMIRSFMHLQSVNPGFAAENRLTLRLVLPQTKYPEGYQKRAFFERLIAQIEGLPGVRSVGAVTDLPLANIRNDRGISIEHRTGMSGGPTDSQVPVDYIVTSSGYFEAMGITLMRGRRFEPEDEEDTPGVIINETMSRTLWPNEDPLGQRIRLGNLQTPFPWLTIVGVITNVKHLGLDAETKPEMYVPYRQRRLPAFPVGAMFLVVQTAADPHDLIPALRREVLALDGDQPIVNIATMEERLAKSISQRRFNLLLLTIAATFAFVLAVSGIYCLMSWSVVQRTHEIGIRAALGAQRRDILKLVVGQGMTLAIIGVAIGLAGAFALTRLMQTLLFSVSATDFTTFAGVSLLLIMVALLACYLPARRASRVDPSAALRCE